MTMKSKRRHFLITGASAAATAGWSGFLRADEIPTNDPASPLNLGWTGKLKWDQVIDITSIEGANGWGGSLMAAQEKLTEKGGGGGVVYFPPGEYRFEDHIELKDGIILRGADPKGGSAKDDSYQPLSRIEFPKYQPLLKGDGTPIDTAFKGIRLENPESAGNCGVVNLAINRGHIHLGEDEEHRCGGNRIVFGCVLRNAAVADPRVPNLDLGQHAWQRFTDRHHAAVDVKSSENLLVANNRLPKSGDDDFTMKDFILKPNRGSADRFEVRFDYDNRPGLYVNSFCIGGAGGSGDDGTPETHPWGFRKGIIIRDNYLYSTGRTPISFTGDGTFCANNVIRVAKDVWRPTATGQKATSGSSTNDNRAIQMRGWRWVVDGNDFEVHKNWASDRSYYINDGEGLMHEDHCNSDIRDSRLTNNRGNSYLSIYKCGLIDGLHIEGNDISTPGKIADIYVVADRNSGPQPCRSVSIVNNITRSNGILIQGSPAKGNVVKGNRHQGGKGTITNKAGATVSNNQGYEVG